MPKVIFKLKQYLADQSALKQRGNGDRELPSQTELAALVDRHEVTFSRIMNNKSDTISMSMLATIIAELRRRGFSPTFDDLFEYYE